MSSCPSVPTWYAVAQAATALLGASVPVGNCQARILSFIGGPCTEGLGKVVNRELAEDIRSHKVCMGRQCEWRAWGKTQVAVACFKMQCSRRAYLV